MSLLENTGTERRIQSAAEFGRVAVLLGGDSTERAVSLVSGGAVLAALQSRGVDAEGFDPAARPVAEIAAFDRAWIALHGPGGEDGLMQGALEWLGVPYTGSGVLASALTMDKLKTKRVVVGAGLPAPEYAVLSGPEDLGPALARLGLPLMVKPASQGSSVGITKVKAAAEFASAYDHAVAVDPIVFAERFVSGPEYTVGILKDAALPSIRIEPATEFYDYEAKYARNDTQYHCPSGLADDEEAELRAAALATFRVTDCHGWGRVDFMRDPASGRFYFIEINTVPGMTDHSLVPKAARQVGIDFPELTWRILETSFLRQRKAAVGGPAAPTGGQAHAARTNS
jgi:D-alanine-D-alanine ligase